MELYFSLHPSWQFTGKRLILLKDIADIYCSGVLDPAPGSLPVFRLPTENMQPHYRLTAFDVACLLQRTYPKARIVSMGEKEILLSSYPQKTTQGLAVFVKVALISVILFFGASTAIISFHHDGEIPKVLQDYYQFFTGEESERPYILEIPYSLGLACGILLFFHHFSRLGSTKDPTPLEVQITTYEQEVATHKLATAQKDSEGSS
ncbi:MAG TPA: stage V sporulation protein AA [Firmicutes bacterium]|nr:stage V sporulation protein AA [Bacillota bacterium]